MLDIRAVEYLAPLSEVDFAEVTLTVRLVNYSDETGLVSGGFRIYNGTTGLLVHQSDIVPIELSKCETAVVSALTGFSPPAPADDTYFVLFDAIATNPMVPDGITIHLGSFYFDVKPAPLGPIPASHAVTHEDTGIDEINVAGLSGLLSTPQTPITHHPRHEVGGNDEMSVTGLSGTLADPQPYSHTHAGETLTANGITNPTGEVLLKQTGAIYGATQLSIRNQFGAAGALFTNLALNLVDFGFKPSSGYQSNLRIEARNSEMGCADNAGHSEFQFIDDATNMGSETRFLALGKDACAFLSTKSGFLTASPTAAVDINSDILRLRTAKTPANAGDTGNPGDICWDANYIYVCVAANSWKRAGIAAW